jgi:predicted peptidase
MNAVLAAAVAVFINQATPASPGVHDLTLQVPGGGAMTYALSIPRGYSPDHAVPLVLVLHSGGARIPNYGREFMKGLVLPALGDLRGIMIAPDCPAASWTDATADQLVMTLLQQTLENYAIDRRRVLVTGYSMGGRGTWFMASHHPDLFTAAIPMAASTGDDPVERLGTMPTYVIHSRNDEVIPFAPAERTAKQLTAMGRPVTFDAVSGLTHFQMGGYVDALRRAGGWIATRWNAAQ